MQQKIHPGLAAGIILVFVGIVGFMLWWPNRPRPVPTHFGPLSPAQATQTHGESPQSPPDKEASPPIKTEKNVKPKGPIVKAKVHTPEEKK